MTPCHALLCYECYVTLRHDIDFAEFKMMLPYVVGVIAPYALLSALLICCYALLLMREAKSDGTRALRAKDAMLRAAVALILLLAFSC